MDLDKNSKRKGRKNRICETKGSRTKISIFILFFFYIFGCLKEEELKIQRENRIKTQKDKEREMKKSKLEAKSGRPGENKEKIKSDSKDIKNKIEKV